MSTIKPSKENFLNHEAIKPTTRTQSQVQATSKERSDRNIRRASNFIRLPGANAKQEQTSNSDKAEKASTDTSFTSWQDLGSVDENKDSIEERGYDPKKDDLPTFRSLMLEKDSKGKPFGKSLNQEQGKQLYNFFTKKMGTDIKDDLFVRLNASGADLKKIAELKEGKSFTKTFKGNVLGNEYDKTYTFTNKGGEIFADSDNGSLFGAHMKLSGSSTDMYFLPEKGDPVKLSPTGIDNRNQDIYKGSDGAEYRYQKSGEGDNERFDLQKVE